MLSSLGITFTVYNAPGQSGALESELLVQADQYPALARVRKPEAGITTGELRWADIETALTSTIQLATGITLSYSGVPPYLAMHIRPEVIAELSHEASETQKLLAAFVGQSAFQHFMSHCEFDERTSYQAIGFYQKSETERVLHEVWERTAVEMGSIGLKRPERLTLMKGLATGLEGLAP